MLADYLSIQIRYFINQTNQYQHKAEYKNQKKMQELNIIKQNNDNSFQEIISLQNFKQRFICCSRKPAYLTCFSLKCLQSSLICQDLNCQCFQLHKKCSFIVLQSIITGINHHQEQKKQGKKFYQEIKTKINDFIEQLSQLKQKIDQKQELYGLNQSQIQLLFLVNQNKVININGNMINKIKNGFKINNFKQTPIQKQFKYQIEIRDKIFKRFYQSFKVFTEADNFSLNKNLFKYSLDVQNLLKGAKKISITPKQENNNSWNKKNYILSNEQLPIKNEDENFYFSILMKKITNGNQIGIGIAYQDEYVQKKCFLKKQVQIGYQLNQKKIIKKDKSIFQNPYCNEIIKLTPSQIICYLNTKEKTISIIYNNEIQMQFSFKQIRTQSKFYAYVSIKDGRIQFL